METLLVFIIIILILVLTVTTLGLIYLLSRTAYSPNVNNITKQIDSYSANYPKQMTDDEKKAFIEADADSANDMLQALANLNNFMTGQEIEDAGRQEL